MNLALFGGFGNQRPAAGWRRETAIAVLGGGEVDLASAPPGEDARLTAVAVLGGVTVTVPPGSRIALSGLSLLGGRDVRVPPGDGPEIRVRAVAILGGVEIKEREPGG
jgi:hypothetical protein